MVFLWWVSRSLPLCCAVISCKTMSLCSPGCTWVFDTGTVTLRTLSILCILLYLPGRKGIKCNVCLITFRCFWFSTDVTLNEPMCFITMEILENCLSMKFICILPWRHLLDSKSSQMWTLNVLLNADSVWRKAFKFLCGGKHDFLLNCANSPAVLVRSREQPWWSYKSEGGPARLVLGSPDRPQISEEYLRALKLVRWWMSQTMSLRSSAPPFSKGWKRMAPRKCRGKGRHKRPQTALRQVNRKGPNQLLPRAKPFKAPGRRKLGLAARPRGLEGKGHPSGRRAKQLPRRMEGEVCLPLLCSRRMCRTPRQVTGPEPRAVRFQRGNQRWRHCFTPGVRKLPAKGRIVNYFGSAAMVSVATSQLPRQCVSKWMGCVPTKRH